MDGFKLSQDETGYVALSTNAAQACANCRWFMAGMNDCHLVKAEPEPILPTGLCDRWELRAVEIEEPEMTEEGSGAFEVVEEWTDEERSLVKLLSKLKDYIRPPQDDGFIVFKGLDNRRYWIAKYTNNFKDRENEYFTDAAHDDYVNKVTDGTYPMPELWTYHTRNTRHGVAERVWKSGGFVFALGSFDDTPEAQKAYAFYRRNRGKIKLSHGFYYPSSAKKDGVYHQYRTFEISTLPAGVEANPYTDFRS